MKPQLYRIATPMRALFTVLAAAILTSGCSAQLEIAASTLRYPVSLSGAIADADGHLYLRNKNLKTVAMIDETVKAEALEGEPGAAVGEIGEELNRIIEAAGGEGAVNVRLGVGQPCGKTCVKIRITGAVVKRRDPGKPDLRAGPTYPVRTPDNPGGSLDDRPVLPVSLRTNYLATFYCRNPRIITANADGDPAVKRSETLFVDYRWFSGSATSEAGEVFLRGFECPPNIVKLIDESKTPPIRKNR